MIQNCLDDFEFILKEQKSSRRPRRDQNLSRWFRIGFQGTNNPQEGLGMIENFREGEVAKMILYNMRKSKNEKEKTKWHRSPIKPVMPEPPAVLLTWLQSLQMRSTTSKCPASWDSSPTNTCSTQGSCETSFACYPLDRRGWQAKWGCMCLPSRAARAWSLEVPRLLDQEPCWQPYLHSSQLAQSALAHWEMQVRFSSQCRSRPGCCKHLLLCNRAVLEDTHATCRAQ